MSSCPIPTSDPRSVMSADRVWYSASFYLGRTVPAYYHVNVHRRIRTLLNNQPEALVLVRTDDQLRTLVRSLREGPIPLSHEVYVRSSDARVAVVAVRGPDARAAVK